MLKEDLLKYKKTLTTFKIEVTEDLLYTAENIAFEGVLLDSIDEAKRTPLKNKGVLVFLEHGTNEEIVNRNIAQLIRAINVINRAKMILEIKQNSDEKRITSKLSNTELKSHKLGKLQRELLDTLAPSKELKEAVEYCRPENGYMIAELETAEQRLIVLYMSCFLKSKVTEFHANIRETLNILGLNESNGHLVKEYTAALRNLLTLKICLPRYSKGKFAGFWVTSLLSHVVEGKQITKVRINKDMVLEYIDSNEAIEFTRKRFAILGTGETKEETKSIKSAVKKGITELSAVLAGRKGFCLVGKPKSFDYCDIYDSQASVVLGRNEREELGKYIRKMEHTGLNTDAENEKLEKLELLTWHEICYQKRSRFKAKIKKVLKELGCEMKPNGQKSFFIIKLEVDSTDEKAVKRADRMDKVKKKMGAK